MGLKSPKLAPRSLETDEEREERNQGNEMPFASKKKLYNAKEQNEQTLFSSKESKQAKTVIKLSSQTRVTIKYCNRYLCRSNYRTKNTYKTMYDPYNRSGPAIRDGRYARAHSSCRGEVALQALLYTDIQT